MRPSETEGVLHGSVPQLRFYNRCTRASIADCLVTTDMRGIRSHGTVRVEMYLTQVKKGAIDPKGVPEVVRDSLTSAVIDGQKAAGAPVCDLAVSMAREKAGKYGMGMVAVRNSNHFGPAGHWSSEAGRYGYDRLRRHQRPPAGSGARQPQGRHREQSVFLRRTRR